MKDGKIIYSIHYVLLDDVSGKYATRGNTYETEKDQIPAFHEMIAFISELNPGKDVAISACFPVEG
jgi:hypothetical protein